MELCEQITAQIEPSLTNMGYEIVRVVLRGGDVRTLQVMAERLDRRDMTVDDCEAISKMVSALLDVSDPIPGRWTLEVSSPGIDRPLVRLNDYERFAGFEAKIETVHDIGGRRRFKGQLLGLGETPNTVLLNFEGNKVAFEFDNILKAKLILTDELIKKQQR